MSRFHIILVVSALLIPLGLQSQGERYQHPVYEISFEASPNWTEHFPDAADAEYSVVNPNHNMTISLGYVPDCKRPLRYMRKLSGFKGLACPGDAYDTLLNDQEALIFCGNQLNCRESFSTMVIGFPTPEGLYLMQVTSPENCQNVNRQRLQSILNTVRVGKTSAI